MAHYWSRIAQARGHQVPCCISATFARTGADHQYRAWKNKSNILPVI